MNVPTWVTGLRSLLTDTPRHLPGNAGEPYLATEVAFTNLRTLMGAIIGLRPRVHRTPYGNGPPNRFCRIGSALGGSNAIFLNNILPTGYSRALPFIAKTPDNSACLLSIRI